MSRVKMFYMSICITLLAVSFGVLVSAQSTSVVAPRITKAKPISSAKPVTALRRNGSNPALDTIVNIRLKNAPLQSFLDALNAQTRANFLAQEGLEKKSVTAFIKGITARKALMVLLKTKNLTYQQISDDVFVILERPKDDYDLVTKIYTFQYISLLPDMGVNREMEAITSQSSGGAMEAGVSGGTSSRSGMGQRSLVEGVRGAGEQGFEGGVAILNVIKSVLSPKGKIAVEPRTNSVVITDVPDRFIQIEQIIAELDIKSPQVLIEAKIVEVNSDYTKELGLKWGDQNGAFGQFTGPVREHTYFLRQRFFNDPSWGNFFNLSDQFTDKGLLSLSQFQILLSALITKGEGRYLGKPKVVTLNNKTAIITTSRNAATSVSSETTDFSSSQSVERFGVGLTLRVTPQVNADGYITLLVQPSYSSLVPSALETSEGPVLDPISRGVSTQIRVKNGETVVIGGLISTTSEKTVRKVPLLGYIPILGWLFTNTSTDKVTTDLVIMITPTILAD